MTTWIKPEWVKNLKVGDTVWQVETHPNMPNGRWKWQATIINIADNYIETKFHRDPNLEWLKALVQRLAPNHRTYNTQCQKNYFDPLGNIAIEI